MDENDILKSYKEDDLVWEHPTHKTFQEGCYECHQEDRLIQAKKLVTKTVGRMDNYPPGFNLNLLD
jgi:hypothetical protein